MSTLTLPQVIARLQTFYGTPAPPSVSDPFEQVLWENVAYLAPDEKRAAAFSALRKTVGLGPKDILKAKPDKLLTVTRMGGMVPELRAQRLRQSAEIVQVLLQGQLNAALDRSLPSAIKTLRRFPTIGEPGAEKILMFAGKYPVLGLESNGLRVLLRMGFAEEQKSYAASYRAIKNSISGQLPKDCASLVVAHQLLRTHGQELCKRSQPLCNQCPLKDACAYAAHL
jgi:endonuclease-3